jgi:hypothetical protein
LIALFLPLCTVQADKIFLRSGQTIEGKILQQNAASVRIEYSPVRGIIDEKKIPIDKIAKIVKTTPDQAAFKAIETLFPFPDLMSPSDYDEIIRSHLNPFIHTFPESDYLEEVEKFLAEAEEERKLVQSGHRKLDGQWYSAREYNNQRYNLEARISHVAIERLIEERAYKKALQAFEKMESKYKHAIAYPEAVVSSLEVLDTYGKQIDAMIIKQPILAQKREEGMHLIDIRKQATIKQALKEELAEYQARRKQEAEEGEKWKTLYPYDLQGLTEQRATVEAEIERLGNIDLEILRNSLVYIATALEHIEKKEFAEASAALSKAIDAGADLQFVDQLKEKIAFTEGVLQEGIETAAQVRAEATATENTGDESTTSGEPQTESADSESSEKSATDQETPGDATDEPTNTQAEESRENSAANAIPAQPQKLEREITSTATSSTADTPSQSDQKAPTNESKTGGFLGGKLPFILAPALIILVAIALNKRQKDAAEEEPKKKRPRKKESEEQQDEA